MRFKEFNFKLAVNFSYFARARHSIAWFKLAYANNYTKLYFFVKGGEIFIKSLTKIFAEEKVFKVNV